jgi:DNA excision repair protein ERCC-2
VRHSTASVFFSATLAPPDYYQRMFGLDSIGETRRVDLPSPFPSDNLTVIIHRGISTKYKDRKDTYSDVAESLNLLMRLYPGNHLYFFPSYAYLEEVYGLYAETNAAAPVSALQQTRNMDENERAAFLDAFTSCAEIKQKIKTAGEKSLVGFVVMGGIFGEGVDLAGDSLVGAAVIGVGLPAVTFEQEHIRDYFQRKDRAGFEYAYIYPGMNRVLQAAGRVIRSETDTGVVLLVGSRFTSSEYSRLFPPDWRPHIVNNTEQLMAVLQSVHNPYAATSEKTDGKQDN